MENFTKFLGRNRTGMLKVLLLVVGMVWCHFSYSADRYSVANGNWNSTSTWSATNGGGSGASVPIAGDVVYIGGHTITVTADVASSGSRLGALTFIASGGGISVDASTTIYLSTVVVRHIANTNVSATFSGSGIADVGTSVTIGSDITPATSNVTTSLNLNISVFNTPTFSLNTDKGGSTFYNQAALNLQSGTITVSGATAFTTAGWNTPTASNTCLITNNSGSANSVLKITNAATAVISPNTTITNTLTLNGGTSTVEYSRAGAQTLPVSGTGLTVSGYQNLTLSGNGTKTAAGAISVAGTLTYSSGSTFDMSTFALSGALTPSGTGTLKTANTSVTPIPTGLTWTGTVEYSSTSAQTLMAGTYSNLTMSGSGSTKTASGNIILAATSTLTLGTGTTLDLSTYTLSGGATSFTCSGTGTLKTSNTSTAPIMSGQTWTGTVNYASASNQTVANGSYSNLNTSTGGTKTIDGDVVVSGVLTVGASTTFSFGTTARTVTLSGTGTNTLVNSGTAIDMSGSNAAHILKIAASSIGTPGTITTGTGSTIEYNGTAQTIINRVYNHLLLSTSGAKTMTSVTTVNGNFTMSTTTPGTTTTTATTAAAFSIGGNLSVASGCTLTMGNFAFTTSGTTSITGTINTATGATGTRTFTGSVTINSGGVWNLSGLNPPTSFGGDITFDGATFNNGTGAVTLTNSPTITVNTGTATFGGVISGAYNITKSGSGTLALSGANTYSGNTVISNGTVTLGVANALPVGASVGTIQTTTTAGVTLNLGLFNLGTSTASANSAGVLDFDVNTTINLGSGGTNSYYFKASNGQTWGASTVTIYNWTGINGITGTGPKIFIGSDATGVTTTQLAKIIIDGYGEAMQLSTGEIVPKSLYFRSLTSGNWGTAGTWESSSDNSTWATATRTPTNGDNTITIRSPHTVTVAANVTTDETTVNSGGTLSISSTYTLTVANGSGTDLTIDGTLTNAGTVTTTGTVTVAGTYNHTRDGGVIPTATWSSGSTCNVTGITSTACTGLNQNFHHVIWNCTSQATDVNMNVSPTWSGNFTISSTGSGSNVFAVSGGSVGAVTSTLYVVGNVSINGGILVLSNSGTAGGSLDVGGNMTVSNSAKFYGQKANWGSTLTVDGDVTTSNTATFLGQETAYRSNSTWNFYGNVDLSVGTTGACGSAVDRDNYVTINLYGSSKSIKLSNSNTTASSFSNFILNVKTGAFYTLGSHLYFGGIFYTSARNRGITVENGGVLDLSSYIVYDAGNTYSYFIVNSGGKIKTANTAGIVTAGTSGSVQTTQANNSFNTAGIYEYNGSSAQVTGTALPTSISGNLIINNNAGVTLTQATTITGTLDLTSGLLVSSGSNIIIIGSGGTITNYSSSSYVNGIVKYYLTNAANHFFPIGDASNYRPFEMNSVSCTSGAIVQVNTSSSGASTVDGTMASVSARNWFMDYVSGTLNSATIRITESGLLASNEIGKSATQSGNYTSVGGASIGSTISSNGAVTLSNTDAYFAIGVLCTPPTTPATSLQVVGRSGKDVSLTWTRGNGSGVVVFVKATSDFTSDPTADAASYTANANYSSGTAMGGGYTVYSGTGTSVTVSGLSGATTYYIRVYERSASGCFNTTELSGTTTTYCLPATGGAIHGISRVQFNTIDNSGTTASALVTSYINTSTTLVRGTSYNLTVTARSSTAYTEDYVRVWIDWNNDGTFNTTAGSSSGLGEQYDVGYIANNTSGAALSPLSIKVPTGAASGYLTMRVSSGYEAYFTSCATGSASNADAEFEDYTIIIGACPTYSGPYTVGTGGTWSTLTDALAELKACTMTGSVTLELDETYRTTQEANETYPLDFSGLPTTSAIKLTIRPKSNVTDTIKINGSSTNTLFDLNSANYITVDGRLGGSGANRLIIENTSTAGGSAIKFSNDATNNTIRNCTLKSNFGSSSEGIVNFSTTTGSTGNDDNTITYCILDGTAGTTASPSATGTAQNGIYSAGHATYTNSTNTISYCEFKDIFVTGGTTVINGIYLDANNTNWSISNNSFYQTSSRTATVTSATVYGIRILGGSQYTISSNSIGGSGASCSGTWTQALSGSITSPFVGISLTATAGATASTISKNTIAAFNVPQVSSEGWKGIDVLAGNVTIGGSTSADGNIIGATSGTGSITFVKANNATASEFTGIQVTSANTVTIQYNTIGSITVSNASNKALNFLGISTSGAATYTVSNNTIGTATASSIQMNGASTSGYFKGIYNNAAGSVTISNNSIESFNIGIGYFVGIEDNVAATSPHTISSNTIGGTGDNSISISSTSTTASMGINAASTGIYIISSNTIQNISQSGDAAKNLHGIQIGSTGTYTVSENTIDKLYNNTSTNPHRSSVMGVNMAGIPNASSVIEKNKITNFKNLNPNGGYIYGIIGLTATSLNAYNNFFECDNEGSSNNNALSIYGIYGDLITSLVAYHNTIKISGHTTNNSADGHSFCIRQGATPNVKNNILINTRTDGGSTASQGITYGAFSNATYDYNYYYVKDATLTSGGGTSSIYHRDGSNTLPTINSDGSLPLASVTIVGTGTNVFSTVGTDLFGTARSNSTPTKGCYEYAVVTITLASNTVSAANNCASSTKVPIQSFTITASGGIGNLTNVGFTSTGTYAQADIDNYKLWYGTTDVLTANTTTLITTLTSSGGQGARTFTAFTTPTLTSGTTYYFWITVDLTSVLTNNNTIAVNAISTSNLTSTSTKAGSDTDAGGTQTLKALPIPTFTAQAGASACASSDVTYTTEASKTNYTWIVPGTLNTDYSITSGDLGTSSNTVTLKWLTTGSKTVTINYTDGNSCTAASATSSTATTVNALPSAPTAVTPSSGVSICNGSNTNLNATSAGNTIYWYTVSSAGSSLGTSSSAANFSVSPTSNTTYYAESYSTAGCVSSTRTATALVTVDATSNAGATSSDQSITSGNSPADISISGYTGTIQWEYSDNNSSYTSVGGASTSATLSSATMGVLTATRYYRAIVTSGVCSSVTSNVITVTVTSGTTTFYYVGSGSMATLSNWGSNSDGTGTNPASMTATNHTYYITHNTTTSPTSNVSWSLDPSSKIIVGNGTNATNFTIDSGYPISGTIDVADNATLTIAGTTNPTLGDLDAGSTIVYAGSSAQTLPANDTIPKLTINNSNGVSLGGNATVSGTLTLTAGKLTIPSSTTLTLGTTTTDITLNTGGSTNYIVCTDTTAKIQRYINANATTYTFPMGDASSYNPMTLNFASGVSGTDKYVTTSVKNTVAPGFVMANFSNYIKRYWLIYGSTNFTGVNYTITYKYNNSDVQVLNTEHTLIPVKRSGATWYKPSQAVNITNGTVQGSGTIDTTNNICTWSGLTSFSFDMAAGDEASALPIHLLYFKAKPESGKVRLDWSTASETNNDYFTVERSKSGSDFSPVLTVPGAGTSTTTLYYFGYDKQPYSGISYYRLKQTDFDGKFEYSEIESVNLGEDKNQIALKIYPNPAIDNTVHISFTSEVVEVNTINVYDAVGKIIYTEQFQSVKGINEHTITIPDLAEGIYNIELESNSNGKIIQSVRF